MSFNNIKHLFNEGETEEALQLAEDYLKKHAKDPEASFWAGLCTADMREFDWFDQNKKQALDYFTDAINSTGYSQHQAAKVMKGWSRACVGKMKLNSSSKNSAEEQDAKDEIDAALADIIDVLADTANPIPDNVKSLAYNYLACIYYMKGNYEQAAENYKNAIDNDPYWRGETTTPWADPYANLATLIEDMAPIASQHQNKRKKCERKLSKDYYEACLQL